MEARQKIERLQKGEQDVVDLMPEPVRSTAAVVTDEMAKVTMEVPETNGGHKREGGEDLTNSLKKKSKYDQICRTVGPATLIPGSRPSTALLRLSLPPEPEASTRTAKVTLSKHCLKHFRELGCTLGPQVSKHRVLACQGASYVFCTISFTKDDSQPVHLPSGFHLANFSIVPVKLPPLPESIEPLLASPKEDMVLGEQPKQINLTIIGEAEKLPKGSRVLLLTACPEGLLLNTSLVTLDFSASQEVEVLLGTEEDEEVSLTSGSVAVVAEACDSEESLPRLLKRLGVGEEEGLEEDEESRAGQDLTEGQRLAEAEAKKLEGNKLFSDQKMSEALARYTIAIELNPEDATFLGNRSACHLALGCPDKGLEDARRATRLQPDYAKGWLRGLKCSIQLGDMVQAREMAEQVLALSPGLKVLVEGEMEVVKKVERLEQEVATALEKELYSQALHSLDLMAEACPQGRRVGVQRAEIFAQKQNFFMVKEVLVKAFGPQEERVEVHYVKGLMAYYKMELSEVFSQLSRVLEQESRHHKARRFLLRAARYQLKQEEGSKLFKAGMHQEAIEAYTEALAIDKLNTVANARLYFARATNAAKLKRLTDTVDDCSSAVLLDKGYTEAFLVRAGCFMELESFDEAVKDYEQAVRLEPKNIEFAKLLSEANEKLRNSKNKDFYALLGVKRTADLDTIKKAYRKAALTHHPDRHSCTEEALKNFHEKKFKDIGEAYGVLSDDVKRKQYDQGTLYRAIQASAAQHAAQAATLVMAQAQAQAALLARMAAMQHQQGMRGGLPAGLLGMPNIGLVGVGPGGRPGGLPPAWLSGVPGVAQRLPFMVPGARGPLGSMGLLGGLPNGSGLLGGPPRAGMRPHLNPRFPYRF